MVVAQLAIGVVVVVDEVVVEGGYSLPVVWEAFRT